MFRDSNLPELIFTKLPISRPLHRLRNTTRSQTSSTLLSVPNTCLSALSLCSPGTRFTRRLICLLYSSFATHHNYSAVSTFIQIAYTVWLLTRNSSPYSQSPHAHLTHDGRTGRLFCNRHENLGDTTHGTRKDELRHRYFPRRGVLLPVRIRGSRLFGVYASPHPMSTTTVQW